MQVFSDLELYKIKKDFIERHANLNIDEFSLRAIEAYFKLTTRNFLIAISGGKDSTSLAHLFLTVIRNNPEYAKRVYVLFIDEEGIFPCFRNSLLKLRDQFLKLGARFIWTNDSFAHYCAVDFLAREGDMYKVFESAARDVWIRPPEPFSVKFFYTRKYKDKDKTYQEHMEYFLRQNCELFVSVQGVRKYESRIRYSIEKFLLANNYNLMSVFLQMYPQHLWDDLFFVFFHTKKAYNNQKFNEISNLISFENAHLLLGVFYPIYYWPNGQVWKYLYNNKIEIPDVYFYMYIVGVSKSKLRVSHLFSPDTIDSLGHVVYYYPNLYDKIIKRMPGAAVVFQYYGTELVPKFAGGGENAEKNKTALEEYHKAVIKQTENMSLDEISNLVSNLLEKRLKYLKNTISEKRKLAMQLRRLKVAVIQAMDILKDLYNKEQHLEKVWKKLKTENPENAKLAENLMRKVIAEKKGVLKSLLRILILGDPKKRVLYHLIVRNNYFLTTFNRPEYKKLIEL